MPVLAQANGSRLCLTVISLHTALLLAVHKGLKVESRYKAFRHGESEFYDVVRRLLDCPDQFGAEEEVQLEHYFAEVESLRRSIRAAETDAMPTLEDARETRSRKAKRTATDNA